MEPYTPGAVLFKERPLLPARARARGTSPTTLHRKSTTTSRSALQWQRANEPLGSIPPSGRNGGRWLVKLIRVKWSLNGTRIDCQNHAARFCAPSRSDTGAMFSNHREAIRSARRGPEEPEPRPPARWSPFSSLKGDRANGRVPTS